MWDGRAVDGEARAGQGLEAGAQSQIVDEVVRLGEAAEQDQRFAVKEPMSLPLPSLRLHSQLLSLTARLCFLKQTFERGERVRPPAFAFRQSALECQRNSSVAGDGHDFSLIAAAAYDALHSNTRAGHLMWVTSEIVDQNRAVELVNYSG